MFLLTFSEDWLKLQEADDDAQCEVVSEDMNLMVWKLTGMAKMMMKRLRKWKKRQRSLILEVVASKGEFARMVVTKSKSPALHRQAKKAIWGDLWPC